MKTAYFIPALIITALTSFIIGAEISSYKKQNVTEYRANLLQDKECYNNQDIEFIIFEETQL